MSSPQIHNLSRIAVVAEASGAFATDVSASATYLDVPFMEGSANLTLEREQLEPQPAQQYIDGRATSVLGRRKWNLQLRMVCSPTGRLATATTASLTAGANAQLTILDVCFGGSRGGVMGSTARSGSTTTAIQITTGHGSRFAAGSAMAWVNSSSQLEMREIEAIDTSAITLKHALSGTPSVGNAIYNSTTIYPVEDPRRSLQFVVRGVETEDRFLLMGGQGSIGFETPVAGLPVMTCDISGAHWYYSSEAAASTPWTTLGATYSNWNPLLGVGEFLLQVVSTATRQIAHVSEINYALNLAYADVTSPTGTGTALGVRRKRRTRPNPLCEVSFTQLFSSDSDDAPGGLDLFAARDARTDYHAALQLGRSTTSGAILLVCPQGQVWDAQRIADGAGMAASRTVLRSRLDTDAGGISAGERNRSAFRFHTAG